MTPLMLCVHDTASGNFSLGGCGGRGECTFVGGGVKTRYPYHWSQW